MLAGLGYLLSQRTATKGLPQMNQTIAASLACDTIRSETSEMSDERVRRTA